MTQRDRSRWWGSAPWPCVLGLLAASAGSACNKPSAGPGLEPPAPGAKDAGSESDGNAILEPAAGNGGGGGLGAGGAGGSVSSGGDGGDSECGCVPGDAGDDDAGVEPDSGPLR